MSSSRGFLESRRHLPPCPLTWTGVRRVSLSHCSRAVAAWSLQSVSRQRGGLSSAVPVQGVCPGGRPGRGAWPCGGREPDHLGTPTLTRDQGCRPARSGLPGRPAPARWRCVSAESPLSCAVPRQLHRRSASKPSLDFVESGALTDGRACAYGRCLSLASPR